VFFRGPPRGLFQVLFRGPLLKLFQVCFRGLLRGPVQVFFRGPLQVLVQALLQVLVQAPPRGVRSASRGTSRQEGRCGGRANNTGELVTAMRLKYPGVLASESFPFGPISLRRSVTKLSPPVSSQMRDDQSSLPVQTKTCCA
jgi:hypothetical protein